MQRGRDSPILGRNQLKKLLRSPDKRTRLGRRDAALLAILCGTGCRVGEAIRLRRQDVEKLPNGRVLLTVRTLKRRDGHRRRLALMPPFVRPVLKHLAATAPSYWLFGGRKGEHLSVRAAQDAVSKHLRHVRPDLRVHDLCHTAITTLLRQSGGDVWLAVNLAGHETSRGIINIYGHYSVKDALRAGEYIAAADWGKLLS